MSLIRKLDIGSIRTGGEWNHRNGTKIQKRRIRGFSFGIFQKHPLAKSCGRVYIYQNDEAQADSIELVSEICKLYWEETENN